MYNMGVQVNLPDPTITSGSFIVSIPDGSWTVQTTGTSVFLVVHIQSPDPIPTTPPATTMTLQYRALNTSFRDETATQLNNFISFVIVPGGTFILCQIQALS
jgi:hypothetical protein